MCLMRSLILPSTKPYMFPRYEVSTNSYDHSVLMNCHQNAARNRNGLPRGDGIRFIDCDGARRHDKLSRYSTQRSLEGRFAVRDKDPALPPKPGERGTPNSASETIKAPIVPGIARPHETESIKQEQLSDEERRGGATFTIFRVRERRQAQQGPQRGFS